MAKLFATVDGAVASGRFDDLRGLLGRISLALTMAEAAEPHAPAALPYPLAEPCPADPTHCK